MRSFLSHWGSLYSRTKIADSWFLFFASSSPLFGTSRIDTTFVNAFYIGALFLPLYNQWRFLFFFTFVSRRLSAIIRAYYGCNQWYLLWNSRRIRCLNKFKDVFALWLNLEIYFNIRWSISNGSVDMERIFTMWKSIFHYLFYFIDFYIHIFNLKKDLDYRRQKTLSIFICYFLYIRSVEFLSISYSWYLFSLSCLLDYL